jgi:hypothetical protein
MKSHKGDFNGAEQYRDKQEREARGQYLVKPRHIELISASWLLKHVFIEGTNQIRNKPV